MLKLNKKDSCVRIGGAICLVKNIILDDDKVYIVYKTFKNFGNLSLIYKMKLCQLNYQK